MGLTINRLYDSIHIAVYRHSDESLNLIMLQPERVCADTQGSMSRLGLFAFRMPRWGLTVPEHSDQRGKAAQKYPSGNGGGW